MQGAKGSASSRSAPSPMRRSAGMAFVLVAVFIDSLSFGIVVPVLPQLLQDIAGAGLTRAAVIAGWLTFAYSAVQFLLAPVMGRLSDRFGRRPMLLLALFGFGCDYVLMALAPSLGWLVVGRVLSGVCGASQVVANAYCSDVTSPPLRGRAFGRVSAALAAGFVFGPAMGGLLVEFGARVPFLAAGLLALANALFGFAVLRESLPADKRRPLWQRDERPRSVAVDRDAAATGADLPPNLGALAATFLFNFAFASFLAVWSFSMMARFGWSAGDVGLSMALMGVSCALILALLTGPVLAWCGEFGTAVAALTWSAVCFVFFAFASQSASIWVFAVIGAAQTLANPALIALVTRDVPPERQGERQGLIASVANFANILAPPAFSTVFSSFAADFPGAPFALAAALSALAVLVLVTHRLGMGRAPAGKR